MTERNLDADTIRGLLRSSQQQVIRETRRPAFRAGEVLPTPRSPHVRVQKGLGRAAIGKSTAERLMNHKPSMRTIVVLGSVATLGLGYLVYGNCSSPIAANRRVVEHFEPKALDCNTPVANINYHVTANIISKTKDTNGKQLPPVKYANKLPAVEESSKIEVVACATEDVMKKAVLTNSTGDSLMINMAGIEALPQYSHVVSDFEPDISSYPELGMPGVDQKRVLATLNHDTLKMLEGSRRANAAKLRAQVDKAVVTGVIKQVRTQATRQGIDPKTPISAVNDGQLLGLDASFENHNPDCHSPSSYVLSEKGKAEKFDLVVDKEKKK
jgi:hypothetical protein